jgi:hypothetical protein
MNIFNSRYSLKTACEQPTVKRDIQWRSELALSIIEVGANDRAGRFHFEAEDGVKNC